MVRSKRISDSSFKLMIIIIVIGNALPAAVMPPVQIASIEQIPTTATKKKITVRRLERESIWARRRIGSATISSNSSSCFLNIFLCCSATRPDHVVGLKLWLTMAGMNGFHFIDFGSARSVCLGIRPLAGHEWWTDGWTGWTASTCGDSTFDPLINSRTSPAASTKNNTPTVMR